MVEKCKEITPVPIAPKNYTFVTSYSTAVELGGSPVIIGERINPVSYTHLDVYKRQVFLNMMKRRSLKLSGKMNMRKASKKAKNSLPF